MQILHSSFLNGLNSPQKPTLPLNMHKILTVQMQFITQSRAHPEHWELLKKIVKDVYQNSFARELGRLSQGYELKNSREQTPWILC